MNLEEKSSEQSGVLPSSLPCTEAISNLSKRAFILWSRFWALMLVGVPHPEESGSMFGSFTGPTYHGHMTLVDPIHPPRSWHGTNGIQKQQRTHSGVPVLTSTSDSWNHSGRGFIILFWVKILVMVLDPHIIFICLFGDSVGWSITFQKIPFLLRLARTFFYC
jgi:hypothetical protein